MALTLNGTTGIAGANGSASTPAVQGEDTNTGMFFPAADAVAVATGGSERMRVDSSGSVGIGTSSPSAKIEAVATSSGVSGWFMVGQFSAANYPMLRLAATTPNKYASLGNDADGSFSFFVNGTSGVIGTQAMTLDASGNLLVGTTTPAQTVSTNNVLTLKAPGVANIWGVGPTSSFGSFYVSTSGTGVSLASGATSWGTVSDERQKDIIEPIADAVSKVLSLRSVIGKYKADADGTRRSFLIAQDVQAALPEAIDVGEDEANTLSVKYTEVIPLLVAAIKELTARIAALEAAQ
jgi:hypothetical protein